MSIFGTDATLGKKFTIVCQSLFLNLFQEDLEQPLLQTNVLIMELSWSYLCDETVIDSDTT